MAEIARELDALYQRRREKALRELESRKEALYTKLPELSEIDEAITLAGISHAQAIIKGGSTEAADQLAKRLRDLEEKKQALLKSHGYTPDYLEPYYVCDRCKDTGTLLDADTLEAKPCACYRQLYMERRYAISNILDDGSTGFDRFVERYYSDTPDRKRYGIDQSPRQQILKIRDHCLSFTENFTDPMTHNLYFFGPTGTGKTYMAKSIGLELLRRGYTVLYLSAPSLFEIIRKARFNADVGDDDTYKNLLNAQLLILDDLGTEPASDSRYAEFLTLLDGRKLRAQQHPAKTIISSNMDMKRLYQEYNERIASRISGEYDTLQFAGDDIRILKKFSS